MIIGSVYLCRVEYAIKTFELYKAPESDGTYSNYIPILLKEGLKILIDSLTRVLRVSTVLRHV